MGIDCEWSVGVVLVVFCLLLLQLSHASPRWVGVQVLVRDARAFSCVGSGVDDLRLVHATGEGVERLPDSASTCAGL